MSFFQSLLLSKAAFYSFEYFRFAYISLKNEKSGGKSKKFALFVLLWLLLPVVCDESELDNEKV